MSLKINGTEFNVGTAALSRSVRRDEKYRVTTEDGITHREIRATYVDFELSIGNFGTADYDSLMTTLMATVGDIAVELPQSSNDTAIYTGIFDGISDEVVNDDGTETLWDNLTLSFTGTVPMEV